MPIYEYRCHDCRRRVSIYFRSAAGAASPRCPQCDGPNLERLFSRVVVRRGVVAPEPTGAGNGWGGDDLPADEADSTFGMEGIPGLDDDDPRAIARWTRAMSADLGEPLDPELDRALSDIERGADPGEVLDQLAESNPGDLPAPDDG